MKKKTKAQIFRLLKTLQKECGLEMWSFDVVIEKVTPEANRRNIGAWIDVDLEYSRGTIHIYEDQLRIGTRGLKHNLRHELIHCITSMREEAGVEHINNLLARYEEEIRGLKRRLRRRRESPG